METTGIFLNSENKTWDKRREKVSMTERKGKGGGGVSKRYTLIRSRDKLSERVREREGERESASHYHSFLTPHGNTPSLEHGFWLGTENALGRKN